MIGEGEPDDAKMVPDAGPRCDDIDMNINGRNGAFPLVLRA
jgi:hypothetical protein